MTRLLCWLWLLPMGAVLVRAGAPQPPRIVLSNFVSNLPVLSLAASEAIVSEKKAPCTVRMRLPKSAGLGEPLAGVVRIHGASSQGYPKKSLGLTLQAPVEWLGLGPRAHWVLNAAFVDRSLMRHKLSYDLFRALGTPNAPRFAAQSRFLELFLNGKYQGVFLLMQRVDGEMLGWHPYDSNTTQHACLYKALDHVATFDHLGHDGFEQREPDPLRGEYWGPLDRFHRFIISTRGPDFFDPTKGIAARLDLDNTIDFHLLVLLTGNMDGFDKNLFLGRDAPATNAPPPRFFFAPWDYDATFGRSWDGSRFGPAEWLTNPLFERLLADPGYHKRFVARWNQLRRDPFSLTNICRMIDENAATLGDAIPRNTARWQRAAGLYPDSVTFQEDVAQIKAWVGRRLKWLDQQIK